MSSARSRLPSSPMPTLSVWRNRITTTASSNTSNVSREVYSALIATGWKAVTGSGHGQLLVGRFEALHQGLEEFAIEQAAATRAGAAQITRTHLHHDAVGGGHDAGRTRAIALG